MSRRVIDPRLFWVEAALVDFAALMQSEGREPIDVTFPFRPINVDRREVALRWHVNAGRGLSFVSRPIGMPVGPFTVWRRIPMQDVVEDVGFDHIDEYFPNVKLVRFDRPLASVEVDVQSLAGGLVFGLASSPKALSMLTWTSVPGGNRTVRLSAGRLTGLLVPQAVNVNAMRGTTPQKYLDAADWEPIEIVGMPVDPGEWAAVGDHAADQGPVGALTDPISAALDRIDRGTPPFGWRAHVEPGVTAPLWMPPPPDALLEEVHADLMPNLRDAMMQPQADQAAFTFDAEVPPPGTLQGNRMNASSSKAEVAPVAMLQVGVAGDSFLSLALGYGTNIAEGFNTVGVTDFSWKGSQYDYLVTAPYVTDRGDEFELATMALQPAPMIPPPVAAELTSAPLASLPPLATDGDWRTSTMTRWDRPLEAAFTRAASHLLTRHEPGDTVAIPLAEERKGGALHPTTPAVAPDDEQKNFVHFADRELSIANNPGFRVLEYSVANQNIFGVWSIWQSTQAVVTQPGLPPPRVLSASLDVTAPATGTECAAVLNVDLTWDWTDRSPESIRLVGRMFAAPQRWSDPPNTTPPGGLERELGVAGASIELTFIDDTAAMSGAPPGSDLLYLDPAGEAEVAPGEAQGDGARRYRLRIVGLAADFAATDHIGMALWSQGTERIAPFRSVAAIDPFLAFTSDPIARPVPPELVPLSSLPDAEGRSHARISWAPSSNAASYIVYGSDELTMREYYGMGEPAVDATLSDRVTALLDAWEANPDRRPFTRLTNRPVLDTSIDLELPRGTTGITTFVVVAQSAGAVEGPWPPTGTVPLREELVLRATPRIASPTPPQIEARVIGSSVELTVRTRPGHRVGRVDIHRVRVDDAARRLDTMGPPIASVTPTSPGWSTDLADDGTPLVFEGADTPGPSWRRVWYRAVAWADAQYPIPGEPLPYSIAERGLVVGKSDSSNTVSVAVPPAGPPQLSQLDVGWPGGDVADVQVDWTTTAPLSAPLGDHRIEVDVRAVGAIDPLVSFAGPLADVTTNAPGPVDSIWRDAGSVPTAFHAFVHRGSVDVALDVVVRLIDPIGRATERTTRVDAGSVLPAPEFSELDIFKIVGRGTMVTFDSAAPVRRIAGQAYRLIVTVVPATGGPIVITPPDLLPPGGLPPIRPGPLTRVVPPTLPPDPPSLPPSLTPSVELPGGRIPIRPRPGAFPIIPGRPSPIVVEVDLPDVVLDRNQPARSEPVQIRRQRGTGERRAYSILVTVQMRSIRVELRSPDGRTATRTERVT